MKNIDLAQKSLLISTIGYPMDDDSSIFMTSKHIEIEKIILVGDDFDRKNKVLVNKFDAIYQYFKVFQTEIIEEKLNFSYQSDEYLYLAKTIGENLNGAKQIVVDCNNGPRYLRAIIQDAVSLVSSISKSLFNNQINSYEALKIPENKNIYFHFHKSNNISPQSFRVLKQVRKGFGELDIANQIQIKQSTVSTHLRNLRELGYIEGKSKNSRKKTTLGHVVLDIAESLS